jgi:SAM-dependent methyltransferase
MSAGTPSVPEMPASPDRAPEDPSDKSCGRTASPERYRAYQRDIARRVILPFLKSRGVDLVGKRLLDVGCGYGGMEDVWAEAGASPVGLDINPERIKGLSGEFVAGDIRSLPFGPGTFDIVLAHDCIEHVPATSDVLAEIKRVLAPGGAVFVSFPPFLGPYGGHQHGSPTWVKYFPYGHLLPRRIWLKLADAPAYVRSFEGLARLSMRRFETAAREAGFRIRARRSFIVRPEVALRMGLASIPAGPAEAIAPAMEFLITGVFYVLGA